MNTRLALGAGVTLKPDGPLISILAASVAVIVLGCSSRLSTRAEPATPASHSTTTSIKVRVPPISSNCGTVRLITPQSVVSANESEYGPSMALMPPKPAPAHARAADPAMPAIVVLLNIGNPPQIHAPIGAYLINTPAHRTCARSFRRVLTVSEPGGGFEVNPMFAAI